MKIRVAAPRPQQDWSPQQEAVFDRVANGTRPLVIRARAGSGKTTTLLEALGRVQRNAQRVLLCAFNKSIAEELRRRAPPLVETKTLHAFGFQILRSRWGPLEVDRHRSRKLLRKALKDLELKCPTQDFTELLNLLSLCKSRLCTDEAVVTRFARTKFNEKLAPLYGQALVAAMRAACQRTGTVDYDDMVFVPAVVKGIPVPTFDLVMVDETQDMNKAQLALAQRAAGDQGRLIVVGDDRQGIYVFNGADTGFMDRMIRELGADELLLSVTYRCPTRVVALAQQVVPDIVARPGAPAGRVETISLLQADFQVGDAVLSRYNAPLVRLALDSAQKGIPIRIQGRDFFEGLETLIQNTKAPDVRSLVHDLQLLLRQGRERLDAIDVDTDEYDVAASAYAETTDRVDTLLALAEGSHSIENLLERMGSLFKSEGPALIFSSVHKGKGLEWDRVFLLASTFQPELDDEECNLWYVAVTRSKSELFLIPKVGRDDRPIKSRIVNQALAYGRGSYLPEPEPELGSDLPPPPDESFWRGSDEEPF
jgi:DNA helicase-2/ATP-dependent DNA helicase PcrA